MEQNGQTTHPNSIMPIEKTILTALMLMILGVVSLAWVIHMRQIDVVVIHLVGPDTLPLPHQTVTLQRTDLKNQPTRSAMTDDSGSAYFSKVSIGHYEIGTTDNHNEKWRKELKKPANGALILEIMSLPPKIP